MGGDLRGPVRGSEAIARGELTPYQRRSRYQAIHHDVVVVKGAELTPVERARAAWLWSGGRGVLIGWAASAVHGALWIDRRCPMEMVHSNRHAPDGLRLRADRLADDEIGVIDGMRLSTPERTAFDLARRLRLVEAVTAVDALARATRLKVMDVELLLDRYPGHRGIRAARRVLELVDAGSQSPKETWLRLVLARAGLPRPRTQIPVRNEWGSVVAYLDMGWEEASVAVEYDGDQHRLDRWQYVKDIRRMEMLESMGWIVVRVNAEDHSNFVVDRVRRALDRREFPSSVRRSA